jgi:hypothetical protein
MAKEDRSKRRCPPRNIKGAKVWCRCSMRGGTPHHISPDTKRQHFKVFLNLDDADEGSPYSFSIFKADMQDVNHAEDSENITDDIGDVGDIRDDDIDDDYDNGRYQGGNEVFVDEEDEEMQSNDDGMFRLLY